MPNLWHCKTRFVSPDPSDQVYSLCLRPIVTVLPVARWACKDWRDLVRRTQGPGDSDLHIYARQRPPGFYWKLYQPPQPPTSERPGYEVLYRIPINILNDDTLLEIFNHCRLGDEQGWDLQLQWGKLSHVCRRWRSLIFGSPSYLKIRLPVLSRTSILPMLNLFPPLPIIIDCKVSTRIANTTTSPMIMLWLPFAPVHRDRIHHIAIQASPQYWRQLLVHMNEPFQKLEYLSLASTATLDPAKLILPESFMAPNLRHLNLIGIGLPKGLPLLASTVALVSLKLCRIQLFSPEDLVTRLQHMPQLEELSIDFRFLTHRPITDGALIQTSIPVATLPSLKQLEFHGFAAYLEGLVSRTNAPALERLTITLFNQASFTLPHLSQFMNTTEGLKHPISSILFDREAVSIAIRHREPPFEDVFNLRLGYSWFNWQINSAAQICGTLLPVLSIVEELTLDSHECLRRLRWLDAVTNATMWRDLILPFKHVKKLSISRALWLELSTALHPDNERPELFLHRLLPSLQIGEIKSGIQHQIERFIINARPLGPVVLTPLRGRETIDRSGSIISLSDSDEDSTSHVSSVRRNWPQRTIRIVNFVRNLRRLVPRFPTGS
ncbi:hypothetical protein BC827DRAFT_195423 [Russula dissimulans]|nr:hypothetical protein BC827DRAFT_195423 [Russula dissimulans]